MYLKRCNYNYDYNSFNHSECFNARIVDVPRKLRIAQISNRVPVRRSEASPSEWHHGIDVIENPVHRRRSAHELYCLGAVGILRDIRPHPR